MFKISWIILLAIFAIGIVASQDDDIYEIDAGGGDSSTTESGGVSDSSPSGECEDAISDCKKTAYECTNDKYKPLMCSMCKKTCNFCPSADGTDPCAGVVTVPPPTTPPPTAGPDECIDTANNCGQTAYECKNNLYKPLMCKYCKKTCNFCDDPVCQA